MTRDHDRRQILTVAGGAVMSQLMTAGSAIAFDWTPVAPGEAGLTGDIGARLDKAIADKHIWNLHGLVIARGGHLVFERYLEGNDDSRGQPLGTVSFKPDTLHDLRSVSKSIVGLLYGIALAAGKVPAPEAPLMASFPEYADLAADPQRSRLTVHHALSMTLGTEWDESSIPYTNPANSEIAMDRAPDRYRYILSRPVVMEPGTKWTYCGGATALLARLIVKGTGKALHDYAREVLFDPLGIGPTFWFKGRDGEIIAASGLRMTPRDLAQIGQLMLNRGAWDGKPVVPAEWIARSTTPVVPIDDARAYGYQWYMGRTGEGYWNAAGNGGQRLYIVPRFQLVVAITAGNCDTPDQWKPGVSVMRDVVTPGLM